MFAVCSAISFAIGAILVIVAKASPTGLWLPLFWVSLGGALLALHMVVPTGPWAFTRRPQ